MGQRLHRSAKTTHAIRAAIQRSKLSIGCIAAQYDLNLKTVAKGQKRNVVDASRIGPKQQCSSVLSAQGEAVAVASRRHTLLPSDDCLYRFK